MKRHLTLFFWLLSICLLAQPANDDCSGVIDLGVAPSCSLNNIFTSVDATASDIGNNNMPSCFAEMPERDVWFKFTAANTLLDYSIIVIGCPNPFTSDPAMINPQIALYRGDMCGVDELILLKCVTSANGENTVELEPPVLTPGITYYLRVNDWSPTATPNWGGFKLCIDEISPIFTIDQGGSNKCSGQLFDSGGPDGDYSNNENYVFTICPDEPASCINFNLEYSNIESADQFDRLIIYDGPSVIADLLGTVPYYDPNSFQIFNSTGGICYTAKASSGCITLQFISDGNGVADGFHGSWHCVPDNCTSPAPISINTQPSNQGIVESIATLQTSVTIDNIDCASGQFGIFEAPDSDFGLEKGLVLTTGFAANAAGPNESNAVSTDWGLPGDDDLNALDFPNLTYDACVVELDVYVPTNELAFEYVFASDEYPEFANQPTNDVFGLFISGPDITGNPIIGGQENIAMIPGTSDEVSISNINHTNNWEYFRYNGLIGDISDQVGRSIEYDGMTSDFLGKKKSLTARKKVTPCNTYHLKLVVADKGDALFDSGVFISEMSGGTPGLDITYFNGLDYLVEDCTLLPDEITVSLPLPDMDEQTEFMVVVGGTATQGVDYSLDLPSTLIFEPGETELVFPIMALPDGTQEGTETIEIKLVNDFGCGEIVYATLNFEIQDNPTVEILADMDTLYVCPGSSIPFQVDGATQYNWSPFDVFDNHLTHNPVANPSQSLWVSVNGSIGLCEDIDSVWVEVVNPEIEIEALGNPVICEGESITLVANNNVANTNLSWNFVNSLDDPTAQEVVASPIVTTTYKASVSLENCSASDSLVVNVDPFDFPILTTVDTTICPNEGFPLAEDIGFTTTQYNWSPTAGLPDPSVSAPIATPTVNTTYTLTATSESGACSESATVTIEVLNFDPNLEVEGTMALCAGEETTLTASTGAAIPYFSWVVDGDTISQNAGITVMPDVTTNYQIIATDGGNMCFFDEANIEVIVSPAIEVDEFLVYDGDGNLLGNEPNLLPGQTISLEVITFPDVLSGATYEWSLDGEDPIGITNTNSSGLLTVPIVSNNTQLLYHVAIMDENGCAGEASILANVEAIAVVVPNIFTPDGDNLNDVFRLAIEGGVDLQQFKIYNRWGQVVHEGSDSWDGTFEGNLAPSDVYIYHIIYKLSAQGEPIELKGDVTLIR